MTVILEVKNLNVHYKIDSGAIKALNDFNLKVYEGEVVGIVGESGSGKTTFALSILRLLPPNASILGGEILYRGINLLRLDDLEIQKIRQEKISLIIQGTGDALNPLMTAGWQVLEPIEYHGKMEVGEAVSWVEELFEEVGLGSMRIFSLPRELSVGMRQRIKVAIAISTLPELVIADEPFIGLDPPIQQVLLSYLMRLRDKYKFTMIITTHNMATLANIADKIAVIYAGKILEYNTVINVFKHPIHPYTKGLIGALPDPRRPKKRRLIYIPGSPPSAMELPKGCVFWPRCPFAKDICRQVEPVPRNIDSGLVACHFGEQLKDVSPWDFWTEDIALY